MPSYKSKGTVRYKVGEGDIRAVLFIPDSDYSIKHARKHYAVFAPSACDCASDSCCCTSSHSCDCAIIVKYDPDGNCGVKMCAAQKNWDPILSNAATHQTKVEILVNVEEPKMSELLQAEEKAEKAKKEAAAAKKAAAAAVAENEAAAAVAEKEKKAAAAAVAVEKAAAAAEKAAAGLKECLNLVGITVPAK